MCFFVFPFQGFSMFSLSCVLNPDENSFFVLSVLNSLPLGRCSFWWCVERGQDHQWSTTRVAHEFGRLLFDGLGPQESAIGFHVFWAPNIFMVWKPKIFPNIFPNTNHLQSPLWCLMLWSFPKSWGVPIVFFHPFGGIFREINHRFYHFGVAPFGEIFIWTLVYQSIYH